MPPKAKLTWAIIALVSIFALTWLVWSPKPSNDALLLSHLGISHTAEFQNIATKHRQSGFESDTWIYLEGNSNRITQLIRENGFVLRSQPGSIDRELRRVVFPAASAPSSNHAVMIFERDRRSESRVDTLVIGSGSTQLWLRVTRY